MTKKEYNAKMAALEPLDEEMRKAVTCALLGHSHIVENCFGYITCARCGAQLGDTLGGAWSDPLAVVVGHNCQTCRDNYAKLNWKDKILAPDPLGEKAERDMEQRDKS